MIPSEIILQKRNGQTLSNTDLKSFIRNYVDGDVTDYQMAAMLMAIYFQGMSDVEVSALVETMLHSGRTMDFSHLDAFVADKHSTGGVGDKISIILGPLMASAGLAIPMISGRSLGHTGGTLDKLESIPGFQVNLSLDKFQSLVETIGIGMIGQTEDICPADRKMYALRDVTGTVESIPLICGSIMSKKIAEGIQGLVLDVKVGSGAFMKTMDQAEALGSILKQTGLSFDVKTDVVYTNMDQPLGRFAGLWCEVREAIAGLRGDSDECPEDTQAVTYTLGNRLLLQAGLISNEKEGRKYQQDLIASGKAWEKFLEMVEAQKGDIAVVDNNPMKLHQPQFTRDYTAPIAGYIQKMDTTEIGWALTELGCGRRKTTDSVDFTAGMEFLHKTGDKVEKGEPLIRCFNSHENKLESALQMLGVEGVISYGETKPDEIPLSNKIE